MLSKIFLSISCLLISIAFLAERVSLQKKGPNENTLKRMARIENVQKEGHERSRCSTERI